jgi:hypothetical protein
MQQDAIASLVIQVVGVLVACFGIYVTLRLAKGIGKKPVPAALNTRCMLILHTGPLRRRQRQRAHQLPLYNNQRHFRQRFGIMVVDEIIGQDWTNNWVPMAAGMGVNRLAGLND